jgi:hypothetical protein
MKPASSIFSRLEENGEPPRQSFQVLSNASEYTTRNPCLSASPSNSQLDYWRMHESTSQRAVRIAERVPIL